MSASQPTKPHELSQGSPQSPAILQRLLHNIGQQTPALYVDDTEILLESHRRDDSRQSPTWDEGQGDQEVGEHGCGRLDETGREREADPRGEEETTTN